MTKPKSWNGPPPESRFPKRLRIDIDMSGGAFSKDAAGTAAAAVESALNRIKRFTFTKEDHLSTIYDLTGEPCGTLTYEEIK